MTGRDEGTGGGRKEAGFPTQREGYGWPPDLQQEEIVIDGGRLAVRVGYFAKHVVQALEGLGPRQRVRAQEHLHLPVAPGDTARSWSELHP